jgi:hypothetical protein
MTLHHRSTILQAGVVLIAMLVVGPIRAAPADFTFDVQEIGPQHSHIVIRLRDTSHGNKPVDGAFCTLNPTDEPQPGLCVFATVGFEAVAGTMPHRVLARPGPGTGRYTFILGDPGMVPLSLGISAEVPGETETLTSVISLQ